MLKYLLAQPSVIKFQWELDVLLHNLRSLDPTTPVVLLFLEQQFGVASYLECRYANIETHVYSNPHYDLSYLPAIRPYLCYQYFSRHPEAETDSYFQLDSDVIFRELPDFAKLPLKGKVAYTSDCDGYIGYHYLETRQKGTEIIQGFAHLIDIDPELIKTIPGGGAQWIINQPTAKLWYSIWQMSNEFHQFLQPIESDIQKWTAEMWAQLYSLVKLGWEVKITPELEFCRPTDPLEAFESVKLLHNAGVTPELQTKLFYKGAYLNSMPFGRDFSWVDKTKASIKYVEAIQKTVD